MQREGSVGTYAEKVGMHVIVCLNAAIIASLSAYLGS